MLYVYVRFMYISSRYELCLFFFIFWLCLWYIQKFLGQGSTLHGSSDLSPAETMPDPYPTLPPGNPNTSIFELKIKM